MRPVGGSSYGNYRGLEKRHCTQKSELSNYSRKPGFTATRLRPLARRREITARPLLVFMRERNPCVFERRRRLGWNVRFGITELRSSLAKSYLGQSQSISVGPP